MTEDAKLGSGNDHCTSGTEYECPGCLTMSTFSEGGFGLSCDRCEYTPRKKVRDEIRNLHTGSERQNHEEQA